MDELRARRDRIRMLIKRRLRAAGCYQPIGFHGQGSVAMGTIVRDPEDGYDIDDGIYFTRRAFVGPNGGEMSAYAARQMVLDAAYAEWFWYPPELLKNCIRVYYSRGYHIDFPVYRVTPRLLAAPLIELASSIWRPSDPRAVTRWFLRANARSPGFGRNRQLVRIVRYVKAWIRARPAWQDRILGGFGITRLVVDCYCRRGGRDDQALYDTMRAMQARLHASLLIEHPILRGELICPPPKDARVRYFRDHLDVALERLEFVQNTRSRGEALHGWDRFFRTDFFERRQFKIRLI